MINEMGHTIDAVYYNKLGSDCKAIQHSGDVKEGVQEGFNEVITIDLKKLSYEISYLGVLINSFNGDGFTSVETASVTILQGNNQVAQSMLAGAGRNNAVLAGIIYKTVPTWSYKQV
jgi:tellurium resistance protein TerZ